MNPETTNCNESGSMGYRGTPDRRMFGFIDMRLLNRFGRMGIVAGFSFLVNILLTVSLTKFLGAGPEFSFGIVLMLVFTMNFLLTRLWVFGDRASSANAWTQLKKCLVISFSFRFLEWVTFYMLFERLPWHYSVTLVGVLILSFLTKSVIYDRYVFR